MIRHRVLRSLHVAAMPAIVVGVYAAVVLARSDVAESRGFTFLVLLMGFAALRARFAAIKARRDFWFGFAVFGLMTLLPADSSSTRPFPRALVDQVGKLCFGEPDEYGTRRHPTSLDARLRKLPVTQQGSPLTLYPEYLQRVTGQFLAAVVALLGGWFAARLGARAADLSDPADGPMRPPPLGLAALVGIATLAGVVYVVAATTDVVLKGWNAENAGAVAGHFALYNAEYVVVLMAALEARFAARRYRIWWLGFAVFGGFELMLANSAIFGETPLGWVKSLYGAAHTWFIGPFENLTVQARGMIFMDYKTQEFYRQGYTWAPLAGFPLAAWIGTGAARFTAWISQRRSGSDRRRSSLGRLMIAVVVLGLMLAAARGTSPWWITIEVNLLLALLLGAGLWAAVGPQPTRAWWLGFALFGGVDFLLAATRAGAHLGWSRVSETLWAVHAWIERLLLDGFERNIGRVVPGLGFLSTPAPKDVALRDAYLHARLVLILGICIPVAFMGATLTAWLGRREARRAGANSDTIEHPTPPRGEPCIADASSLLH